MMTLITIYALIGDDIRAFSTTKSADIYFYSFHTIALILFALEIMVQSCVVDDFKYGLLFWLDVIATLSLILDIPMILDIINMAFD
jgi:hypothetical protein